MASVYLYLLLSLPFFLIYFLPKVLQSLKSSKNPPGPRGLPFIGNLHQLDISKLSNQLWQLSKKYGPIMSLKLGHIQAIVISSPKLAKLVMKTHDLTFCSRPMLYGLKKMTYNCTGVVFSPYNDYWREMRKIVTLHLLSSSRVNSFRSIREDEVFQMIKGISEQASSSVVINLSDVVMPVTSIIICRVAFGKRFDKVYMKRFQDLFLKCQIAMTNFYFTDHFPLLGWLDKLSGSSAKMERVFKDMDSFYQEIIDKHLSQDRRLSSMKGDVIDILLELNKDEHSSSMKLTFDNIKAVLMLIGARNFISGESGPPFDDDGHGTHTASTAAGSIVKGANAFGMANGTAAGMAPLAHLAIYRACTEEDCTESDILAAMDAAVEDGVDILSLSLGGPSAPFYADGIALGAFGAIQNGVFVACSAGNSGPFNSSTSNEAPWILTVGASTVDRSIRATALLGNKVELDGESLFQPNDFPDTLLPLVFPGASGDQNATWCAEGSLDSIDVKGKIVVCERGGDIARIAKGQTVKDAGGAGMILTNAEADGKSTIADAHVLPATYVGYSSGETIKKYINSTSLPVATILFRGTVIGVDKAPEVASFSSRGPSLASPGILKPDIIGPGVSILAAWPVSVDNITSSKPTFNMISGTSMSCPHLSGIAALLKSAHPTWSPAAIKSAIMTTAGQLNLNNEPIIDQTGSPADLFAVGAGHVNPSKANDPGLVYDIQPSDYIPYLCGLGYTDAQVGIIVNRVVSCLNETSITEAQLNYPSFSIALGSSAVEYSRVVTNVGNAVSSYTVKINSPPGVNVSVTPTSLDFTKVNQQLTYKVQFSQSGDVPQTPFVEGSLVWMSGKHVVRSPISVKL